MDNLNIILFLLLGILVASGTYLFFMLRSYKHTIVFRRVMGGRRLIMTDKFKEKKDRQGTVSYITRKTKKLLPPLPPNCLEIRTNGKIFVEMYMSPDGTLTPVMDTLEHEDDLKKVNSKEGQGLVPVSTNQRIFYIGELKKREERRNSGFWAKNGPMIIIGGFFIIILVIGVIFAEDIWRPMTQISADNKESSKNLGDASNNLANAIGQLNSLECSGMSQQSQQQPEAPPR